ncbi:MAG TPA: hypothetical protein PLK13_18810 [Xanthobacteraceae bacterium]|jgi:hypothetical protein|nr:hypothetical protein [Xanthobacteraceae bacterium]HQS47723.1 hypothetical protein [Xanthobacteraceae bacterium]
MIFEKAGTIMPVWNLHRVDPGFIYIVENHRKYKIGKSKRAQNRLNAAKTWLPDMKLIGQKPFWGMSHHERCLHTGFVSYWYSGEWFDFAGDDDARDLLLEGFTAFSDEDPDRNSVDFIYWFNGDGMAEFLMEQASQKLSLPKFQKQESINKKRSD